MFELLYIPWFKLHPIDIPGPVDLQPFGIMVAIGILFGSRVATWRGKRVGVPEEVVSNFLFFVIVVGLISAMLLNMAFYEPHKLVNLFKGEISYPGLSSFGGFFGGTMAALYFRQKHRVSLMVLGDIFCFAFPFAWLICRGGCFVVHDHPGIPTDFFLAVDNYNNQGVPRHDLGLYEVLWSAAMIPLLLVLERKRLPAGFFMAFVPLCYAPIRFGLDFLREDAAAGGDVRYLSLTPGHYWAVMMAVAGIVVAVRTAKGPAMQLSLDGAPAPGEGQASASSPPGDADEGPKVKSTTRKQKRQKKAKR
ncbi:MAG: prolipoprotein diacylglyceryl transferase [Myxococcales bacterium]|nr:prolipoprotein diacylglyceryl transferase [Myxococcales bacterium]